MQAIADLLDQARWRLIEAEQKLRDIPQTRRLGRALTDIQYATNYTTSAVDLLDKEKEETCEKP